MLINNTEYTKEFKHKAYIDELTKDEYNNFANDVEIYLNNWNKTNFTKFNVYNYDEITKHIGYNATYAIVISTIVEFNGTKLKLYKLYNINPLIIDDLILISQSALLLMDALKLYLFNDESHLDLGYIKL